MITNINNHKDLFEKMRKGLVPLGAGIGCGFDINFRCKRGDFNIILGHANVGKTYWLMWYLLSHSVVNGFKHLVCSQENSVSGLVRDLIQLHTGKLIDSLSQDELNTSLDFVSKHFDFVEYDKEVSLEEFMKEVQSMKPYHTLTIDPHNSFAKPFGVNQHDYDYSMATKLRIFAKKFGTTVFLCTHAATEALRKTHKEGDFKDLTVPPNAADAEGGGKWVNRCDNFLVIHRYLSSPNDWMYTHVHVKKVKETITGGKPTLYAQPVLFRLDYGCVFTNGGYNPLKTTKLAKHEFPI